MVITIINIVMTVVFVLATISMYRILRAFEELVVKYVEINEGYFKNQKHLMQKASDTAMALKKISSCFIPEKSNP